MYKILLVEESTCTNTNDIDKELHVIKQIKKEQLKKEISNNEYDLIYLQNELLNEEIEKNILSDFSLLPKSLNKLALDNKFITFVNLQLINKIIMDNIKIIEFKDYFEELVVANIIKQLLMNKVKIENIYEIICKNKDKRKKTKKTLQSIISRHYARSNLIRKIKYKLKEKEIQQTFFDKIMYNVETDIKKLEKVRKTNIRVVIADDNLQICHIIQNNLKEYKNVEILGIANTDEEEIKLIEQLQPDIVITDLMRNYKYTGLDIIKEYNNKDPKLQFLIISSDRSIISSDIKIGGFIQKPITDYTVIIKELEKIKEKIEE